MPLLGGGRGGTGSTRWSTRLHILMVPVGGSGYSVGVCSRTGSPYTVSSSMPSCVGQQCGTTTRARWLGAVSAGFLGSLVLDCGCVCRCAWCGVSVSLQACIHVRSSECHGCSSGLSLQCPRNLAKCSGMLSHCRLVNLVASSLLCEVCSARGKEDRRKSMFV